MISYLVCFAANKDFYIMQYSVIMTAQMFYTLLPGRPIQSYTISI